MALSISFNEVLLLLRNPKKRWSQGGREGERERERERERESKRERERD